MARKTSLILIVVIALAAASGFAASGSDRAPNKRTKLEESAPEQKVQASAASSSTTTPPDGDVEGAKTPQATQTPETPPPPLSDPDDDVADDGVPAGEPVHEVLSGAGGPPPAGSTDPIGELDDDGPVPAGLDFVAPSAQGGDPNDFGGPDGLAVVPSCSHQCITSGVAYPRGFGAELVVETSVPASLFMTAIADHDGDGDYEDAHVESTEFGLTGHSWALDHLEPGATYHVMATATDEHDHTAYAWGEFTTLSQRDVFVELGSAEITGGPDGIDATSWKLGLDGPITDVTPGQQGILLYKDLPRYIDIDFWMLRGWDDDICEAWQIGEGTSPQGHSGDACLAWNSAFVDDVDIDVVPEDEARWSQTSVHLTLHPPTGEGNALPPGYGDPYYFHFEVPITLHVTYS